MLLLYLKTDVLILLVWAYVFYGIQKEWYLKYENEKYANIRLICEAFGRELCLALPAFHALTGCDTTSYFFKAGKLRVFKKLMTNKSKVQLLKPLGKERILETVDIDGLKEFIRTVIYSGKENESYVETRIRLYQNLKSKSSMPLPPDPDSVLQVIKRAHHQTYLWLRCCERMVDRLPFEGNGWFG